MILKKTIAVPSYKNDLKGYRQRQGTWLYDCWLLLGIIPLYVKRCHVERIVEYR